MRQTEELRKRVIECVWVNVLISR